MTRLLALVCFVAVGCHAPRARMTAEVELPAVADALAEPVVFGPVARPASAYNQPAGDVPSTTLRDDVFAALVARVGAHGTLTRDARLDLASSELAELAQRGGTLDPEVVEFALRAHGLVETSAGPLVARADTVEAVMAALVPQLGDQLLPGNLRAGVGGGEGVPVVVVLVRTAYVTLPPTTPRFAPPRGDVVLHATLDPAFHSPSVTVSHDDTIRGVDHPLVAKLDRWSFEATIACGEHVGTEWVLIEGHDPDDALTRLALIPISCGVPPRASYRIERRGPAPADAAGLERRIAAVINRERAAAGLPPLRGDLRASEAARREATLMASARSVEHQLGGTSTIGRLRDANLIPPVSLEATLHAPDLVTAAEILMNERGYRELLLRPELTHAAVAVTFDRHHEMYVAIELVQIAPQIDTVRLTAGILARINAKRPADDQIVTDPALDKIAARYAIERARGWSDLSSIAMVKGDHELVFGGYLTMHRALSLLLVEDPQAVDLGPDLPYDAVGISAVQSTRNGALAGRLWVIVLYAKLR